jgi:hypothetical protein
MKKLVSLLLALTLILAVGAMPGLAETTDKSDQLYIQVSALGGRTTSTTTCWAVRWPARSWACAPSTWAPPITT